MTAIYKQDLPEIFNPKHDFVFKRLFADTSYVSAKLRVHLLRAVLKLPIVEARLTQQQLAVRSTYEKRGIIDLRCILNNGNHVLVEMQRQGEYNSIERCTYYMASVLANQDLWGKDYNELQPVYCLLISDFSVAESKEVVNTIRMHVEKDDRHLNLINLVTLELPKIKNLNLTREVMEALSDEEIWAVWFNRADEKDDGIIKKRYIHTWLSRMRSCG